MNFIQLTDLHIGKHHSEYENLNRIIQDIKARFSPIVCPLIVITGDFVHHGTESEYVQVVKKLSELRDEGYQLLACPGNHDFGQGTVGNLDKYQPEARKRYLKYIHNELLGKEHGRQEDWNNGMTIFPITTVFEDEKVLFVGLDSMHGVLDEKIHFATGKVDHNQIVCAVNELTNSLYMDYVKIVYMHHNLYSHRPTMYLKYKEKLEEELIQAGVQMVFFGHTHNFEMYVSSGLTKAMHSVCGRKVTDEFTPIDGISNTLEYYYYSVRDKKVIMTPINFQ